MRCRKWFLYFARNRKNPFPHRTIEVFSGRPFGSMIQRWFAFVTVGERMRQTFVEVQLDVRSTAQAEWRLREDTSVDG